MSASQPVKANLIHFLSSGCIDVSCCFKFFAAVFSGSPFFSSTFAGCYPAFTMAKVSRMHRRCGVRSKARKMMAVCLGVVVLLASGAVVAYEMGEGLLRRSLSSETALNSVATCNLGTGDTIATPGTLTLSESSLSATVSCSGQGNTFVPADLKNVCDGQTTIAEGKHSDTTNCTIGSVAAGKTVSLQQLLGANHEIQWSTPQNTETTEQGEVRTLKLTVSDLPRTDKSFVVGCQKNADTNPSCKVTVNVNARPSSVDDKNVVSCAYGQASNEKAVEVEMSEEKNTLTVDCGKDGSMQPPDYTTQYCAPDGGKLEECTEKYSDILDGFDSKWWTKTDDSTSATLTIPKTNFPTEKKLFLVGCTPKPTASHKDEKAPIPPKSDVKASSCRVLVTVKAASSATSAFNPQVVAATTGVAALSALLAGSV
ncbi:SAG-related sequence SRS12D [Toxoplasma gondii VAND]|uniref:SAG-related sequence SRS12D n=2 Tax=Toxoplasma gondii TaxID=5811 RepID=A0A086PYF3_TOXGO|nr:SAG-related sequence SRS12D [Toxoplasma gondii VAND]